MTLPGKLEPGLKGFPTPNDVPVDVGYIIFYFPNSPEFPQLILGAVKELTKDYNWYQWGEMLPEDAAEAFKQIVTEAPYNLFPDEGVPTPFWDDSSDLEDQEPADVQPWYGEVTDPEAPPGEITFVENVGIWVITGFIAYSGQIGAAVFFNTIAPRFVLAWKRGDVGEIIRIVVDAADYGSVDTSSYAEGDIIEVDVVADPDLETHDIYLVKES